MFFLYGSHIISALEGPFLSSGVPSTHQGPSREQKPPRQGETSEETLPCRAMGAKLDGESHESITVRSHSLGRRDCPERSDHPAAMPEPQSPNPEARRSDHPPSRPPPQSPAQACRLWEAPRPSPPATVTLPAHRMLPSILSKGKSCLNNSFNPPIFLLLILQLY